MSDIVDTLSDDLIAHVSNGISAGYNIHTSAINGSASIIDHTEERIDELEKRIAYLEKILMSKYMSEIDDV